MNAAPFYRHFSKNFGIKILPTPLNNACKAGNTMPRRGWIRDSLCVAYIFLGLFWFSGCMSYDTLVKTWVGKPESEILKDWGTPDLSNTLDSGEKIHTWIQSGTNQYGPYTCQKSVRVSVKHTITNGSSRGCPSISAYAK